MSSESGDGSSCICGPGGRLLFYVSDTNVEDEHTIGAAKCDPMLRNGGDTFRIALCSYDGTHDTDKCFAESKDGTVPPLCEPIKSALKRMNVGFPNNDAYNRVGIPISASSGTCASTPGANLALLYAWGTPSEPDNGIQIMTSRFLASNETNGSLKIINQLKDKYATLSISGEPPACGTFGCVADFTQNLLPTLLEQRIQAALDQNKCPPPQ